jgi:hypothetical protein
MRFQSGDEVGAHADFDIYFCIFSSVTMSFVSALSLPWAPCVSSPETRWAPMPILVSTLYFFFRHNVICESYLLFTFFLTRSRLCMRDRVSFLTSTSQHVSHVWGKN